MKIILTRSVLYVAVSFAIILLAAVSPVHSSPPPPPVVNIPDANFKAALIANSSINTNSDTSIQVSEATAYTGSISIHGLSISDLTGVEAFTNITFLDCHSNLLTNLNVSSNTALTSLNCGFNPSLSVLNVSGATALQSLTCNSDSLLSLDISTNVALSYLDCDNNNLTALDVSTAPSIGLMACYNNHLTSLDLSSNTALTGLNCYNNNLSELNIKNGNNSHMVAFSAINNPNLICIQADDSAYATAHFTTIDVQSHFSTNCSAIWDPVVYIPDTSFKAALVGNSLINTNSDGEIQVSEAVSYTLSIGVSGLSISDLTGIEAFTNLTGLDCSHNLLSGLNVSSNKRLTILDCSNNSSLAVLNVTGDTSLAYFNCSHDSLLMLDVSSHIALISMDCSHNLLLSLNVSGATSLSSFDCSFNPSLSVLNVSDLTALQSLVCNIDSLLSLDVSANVYLQGLDCSNNKLANLNVSGAAALAFVACYNNVLATLDLSANTGLTALNCSNNHLTGLNVKNGANQNISDVVSNNNPDLTCIQVDDTAYSAAHWLSVDAQAHYSTDCNTATSVNDIAGGTDISIYPNPFSQSAALKISTSERIVNATLTIFDLPGNEVRSYFMLNTHEIQIEKGNLNAGIYFYKLYLNNTVFAGKLIVY